MRETTRRSGQNLHPDPSPALTGVWLRAGRLLLCLAGILLVVMPWTEAVWAGDRFLRGGQDVELGILAALTFLCLVLVLSRHLQQTVAYLLKLSLLQKTFQPPCWPRKHAIALVCCLSGLLEASGSAGSLPLQI